MGERRRHLVVKSLRVSALLVGTCSHPHRLTGVCTYTIVSADADPPIPVELRELHVNRGGSTQAGRSFLVEAPPTGVSHLIELSKAIAREPQTISLSGKASQRPPDLSLKTERLTLHARVSGTFEGGRVTSTAAQLLIAGALVARVRVYEPERLGVRVLDLIHPDPSAVEAIHSALSSGTQCEIWLAA